ncbi:MAG: rhomboid family intramembrane serine protease, partial [Lachnospiraceae bacterium]|nr:rhomboid family intramembrane serine protease [Lachnospiraceae bacterium]
MSNFEKRFGKYAISNLSLILILCYVVGYVIQMVNGNFLLYLTLDPYAVLHGQIWRLATFVIVPSFGGNMLFFALSLYFYWFIGSALEREWGSGKFTLFYLLGVVLNIIVGLFSGYASMGYVNLSLFFAFATLYPELQFLLFFL